MHAQFLLISIVLEFYPSGETTADYLFLYGIEMSHLENVVYIGLKDSN